MCGRDSHSQITKDAHIKTMKWHFLVNQMSKKIKTSNTSKDKAISDIGGNVNGTDFMESHIHQ